jgi:prepilin signal peptidase PulO-like enzyme (type II secretory pathway)
MASIYIFLLGASLGSFFNAWAMRLTQESILTPSKCRQCDRKLAFYELIPLFSWVIQGGKCFCKKNKISPVYLGAEVLFGTLFTYFYLNFALVDAIFFAAFSSILLFCFLTDLYHKLLFLPMMLTGFIVGVSYDFYLNNSINFSLTGGFIGFLIMWLIAKTYFWIIKSQGMGEGDKYLMGFVGAWVGWAKVISVLFVSSWIGLLIAVYLMIKKKANLKTALPLGVFIVPAVPITLIFYKYIL